MTQQLRTQWLLLSALAAFTTGACTTSGDPNGGGTSSSGTAGTESSSVMGASTGSSAVGSSGTLVSSSRTSGGSSAPGSSGPVVSSGSPDSSGSMSMDSSGTAASSGTQASSTDTSGASGNASSAVGGSSSADASSTSDPGASSDMGASSGTATSDLGASSGTATSDLGASSGTNNASSGTGTTSSTMCSDDVGCTAEATPLCDPAGSNRLGVCARGADGCLHITALSACPSAQQTCPAGGSACVCGLPAMCQPGTDDMCASNGTLVTCGLDAPGGCPAYPATGTACAANQTCTGAAPSAVCTCTAHQYCTTANGSFCQSATVQAECDVDSNGCFTTGATTTCTTPRVCGQTGQTGACICPLVSASPTEGGGCNTPNSTACDATGAKLLTCVTIGGCSIWAQATDCAASLLVCGVRSGTAQCMCGANPNGPWHADSDAGTSGTAAPFATGLLNPPQCRFNSLTRALSASSTGVSGGSVLAVGAPQGSAMVFSGTPDGFETFPLQVPPGVTLGTVETLPVTGGYIISATSSTAARAITLRSGSRIEKFAVFTALGNPSGTASIACDSGAVSIDHVTLGQAGATAVTTTGILVDGSCSATIINTTVSGSTTDGVVVQQSGPGAAATTITVGSITSSGRGLRATGGQVNLNGVSITDCPLGGILAADTSSATLVINGGIIADNGNTQPGRAGISWASSGGLSLTGTTVSGNGAAGIQVGSNVRVVLGAGTTVSRNGLLTQAGGLAASSGVINATGATFQNNLGPGVALSAVNGGTAPSFNGAALTVAGNTTQGLSATGGSLITLTGSNFRNNAAQGLLVSNSAANVTVTGGAITGNGAGSAPVQPGVMLVEGILTLQGDPTAAIRVEDNAGYGVHVANGAITIAQAMVAGNGNTGVVMQPAPGAGFASPVLSMRQTTITRNSVGVTGTDAVGGFLVDSNGAISGGNFSNNNIFGNGGHQVGFLRPPSGANSWNISSGVCGSNNIIHGYTPGYYGLISRAAGLAVFFGVNASFTSWANGIPQLNQDYSVSAPNTVTVTNQCPATSP